MENKTNEKKEVGLKEIVLPSSPSLRKRVLEHRVEMETKEEDNTWKSACVVVNRHAVTFFSQVTIISGVMLFSIYKLSVENSPEQQTIYLGLLSTCLGILSPSPVFRNK